MKESELYRLRPFKQLDTAERRRQAHVHCQRVSAFLDQFAREAIGLMFAIIITMPYLKNVVILVDALSVADMWDFPQRSRHPIARVMAKVKEVAQQAGMHIFIHWICGAANLADLASRVPEFVTLAAKELFLAHFGVQQEAGAHLKLREQFLPDVMERATDLRVVTTTTGAEPEETERVTELRTATRIVQRMQAQKELEWYAASIKTHLPVEQFLYNRLLHDGLLEQEHFETAEGARDGTLVKLTGVDLTQRYRLFRRVTRARTFFTTNKRTLGAQLQSVVEYAGELKRERATSPGERPDKGHKLCTGMIEYFMYAKQRRINRSAIPWPAEIVRYRQYKNNKTASEEESKRLVGALSVLNEDLLKCRSLKGMPWKGVDLQERANNLKTQALAEAYRDLERANAAWSKDKRTLVATGYSEKPVTTHVTVIITCTLRLAANEIFGLVQEPSRKENPTRAEALQAHVVEYSCA